MENGKEYYEAYYSSYWALPNFRFEYNKFRHRLNFIFNGNFIHINPSEKAIDLGCGFGIKTYVLSNFFQDTTGLDFIKNCVDIASLLNNKDNLKFLWENVSTQRIYDDRYHFITAFGLTVFNVKSADVLVENVQQIASKYAFDQHRILIGTESDFSGKSPSGWHYHTKNEIKEITKKLENIGYSVKIIFPYKHISNYQGNGLLHFILELKRLIFSRKREYYFLLEK